MKLNNTFAALLFFTFGEVGLKISLSIYLCSIKLLDIFVGLTPLQLNKKHITAFAKKATYLPTKVTYFVSNPNDNAKKQILALKSLSAMLSQLCNCLN